MNNQIEQSIRRYWSLLEKAGEEVMIYEGGDVFLQQFMTLRPEVGHFFSSFWCHAEVCNGGFYQFFYNSTGVLAPEAVIGFEALQASPLAGSLSEAMNYFGKRYPRDRYARQEVLPKWERNRTEWDPFQRQDEAFYHWLGAEDARWERAIAAYMEKCNL